MPIAFFDLDKTLISENSAKLWLKAQWGTRNIKLVQMLNASYWLAKYHLGFTRLDDVVEKGLRLIAGEKESEVVAQTKDFFNSTIKNLYRPGALEAIHEHRAQGHELAILTSSFDGLALLVQQDLGFDHCLCTRLEVDLYGYYTGKTIGLPCFGANKVIFAESLCRQRNIQIDRCMFYTDSASDIPLMNLVGQAIAVNPDPHLRARAQLKKWTVVNWGK
jgi:HAD superfamily hydrolase (TIGR01490 family)